MMERILLYGLKYLNDNAEAQKYRYIVYPWRVSIVISVNKNDLVVGLFSNETARLNIEDNKWIEPSESNNDSDFTNYFKPGDIIFVQNSDNKWLVKQIPRVNGAIAVMNIHNGKILAMHGGYSFNFSQYNRATQAYRQPGSAFKPFVYLAAISKGVTTTDLVLDAPFIHDNGESIWRPKNSNGLYNGYVTLRYALEWSKNLPTIRVANSIGLPAISEVTRKLGLYDDDLDNLSQAIGSKETSLIRLLRAYSIIANGGKRIESSLINTVQDRYGKIIYKTDLRQCVDCNNIEWSDQRPYELVDDREQILDSQDAYIITSLMRGVVQRGTGRRANIKGYEIAGKTGTTNDVKDTWFFAFTPDIAVGVYFGYDTPKALGNAASSVSIAVPIVREFFSNIVKDYKPQPFRTPNGIETKWVNYITGKDSSALQKGSILEVFKSNHTEPSNLIVNGEEIDLNEESDDIIY